MKTVVIEIEMEIDEKRWSNGDIANAIDYTITNRNGEPIGKPNYVICRDKFRHHNATNPATPRPPTV